MTNNDKIYIELMTAVTLGIIWGIVCVSVGFSPIILIVGSILLGAFNAFVIVPFILSLVEKDEQ